VLMRKSEGRRREPSKNVELGMGLGRRRNAGFFRWSARKRAGIIGTAIAVLMMAACGSTAPSASTTSRTTVSRVAERQFTVAFVAGILPESYFNSMVDGMISELRKVKDIHLLVPAVPTYSPSTQVPILSSLLAKRPAALILAPTDTKALDPSVERYDQAGIPVFLTDAPINDLKLIKWMVESNNFLGGELAAQFIAKHIDYSGTVGVINFVPGSGSGEPRQEGFYHEMKKYPKIHVLPVEFDSDSISKGASEASAELLAHPHLKAFFGINDNAAEGIAAGIESSHDEGKVIVVGYDADPEEVRYLEEGKLTALVAQHPFDEGVMAIKEVQRYLMGHKSVAKKVNELGLTVVDRNNLSVARKDHILYEGKIEHSRYVTGL